MTLAHATRFDIAASRIKTATRTLAGPRLASRIRFGIDVAKIYLDTLPTECSPELIVDHVWRSVVIWPGQIKSELLELARLVHERCPGALLEIGTMNGGTFAVFCRLSDTNATVISLDLPGGPFGWGPLPFREKLISRLPRRSQRSLVLSADSHSDASKIQVTQFLNNQQLDFLFIDGDHSYGGVKRDFEMYAPLVRKGGMIAFHDILPTPPEIGVEVEKFWKEVKTAYPHRELVENPEQGWAGIGVLFP